MSAVRAESNNQWPITSQSDLELELIQMRSSVFEHINEHPKNSTAV